MITALALISAGLCNYLRPTPLAWDWRPPSPSAPVLEDLTALREALDHPPYVLVDARDAFFFKMGRLPGAVSLPEAETDHLALNSWRATVAPETRVIVYCSDALCRMASDLADKMAAVGLQPVIFKPGFDEWEAAGLPVEVEP